MTRKELEMRKLVRESDVIDKTDGSELAKAFNYLWEKYIEQEPRKVKQIVFYVCPDCGMRIPKNIFGSNHFSPFCPECGMKIVKKEVKK